MNEKILKISILIILFIISIFIFINLLKSKVRNNQVIYTKIESIDYSKEFDIKRNSNEIIKNIEYQNMPEKLGNYKIIGKIRCDKIGLEQYILNETTEETLNLSVTKLCGPKANEIGNFCIIGHNYINSKMFGNIKNLELGDLIQVTDTYDKEIEYKVYNIYTTNPKDITCLSQETDGEKEITLITCTPTGVNRLIVKAVENYD